MLAMGWRGSAKHWARYQKAYLLLAGLSTPLVVSVHSVVSFDFLGGIVPGWHTTIFPPYFVAGAIYSGFAMVLTLAIPVRRWYHLEDLITMRHIECMAKVMLGTGLIVAYGYVMEAFMAWYSGNQVERYTFINRMWVGGYWWTYWVLILCNIRDPAIAVVEAGAFECLVGVRDFADRQRGHVAGAVRHRRHQPDARLRAVVLGHVLSDVLGLGHLFRNSWRVCMSDVPLYSRPSRDLDFRNARSVHHLEEACSRRLKCRQLSALRLDGRVRRAGTAARGRAGARSEAGYRHMDAYSPMPVEGLAEAIGFRYPHGAAARVLSPDFWARPADSRCAGG